VLNLILCTTTKHDLRLVGLAALICLLSCFTTATLFGNAQRRTGSQRLLWVALATIEFGVGVWSLHFVAMLAYTPGIAIAYNLGETMSSVMVAVLGGLAGFTACLMLGRRRLGWLVGGGLLAAAVAGMHQAGIGSMRLPGGGLVEEPFLPLTLLASSALCAAALWRLEPACSLQRRLEVTVWLSAAICAVHFSGMSALQFRPGNAAGGDTDIVGSGMLAIAVGAGTLALLIVSLTASLVSQRLSEAAERELCRMRQLASVSFEGLVIHRDGVILDVNQQLCEIIGSDASALIGTQLISLVAPAFVEAVVTSMRLSPDERASPEIMVVTKGGLLPIEFRVRLIDYHGRAARAVCVRDLTERRQSEAQMRHLAHHDGLTGLPNRLMLDKRLSRALEASRRHGHGVAVLCLDLDRFKPVNDLLGHAAGDRLLVEVAARLSGMLRATDTLARLGGDEFVVVLAVLEEPGASTKLARRIVESLAQPFDIGSQQVTIGGSVGIALAPLDGADGETLLRLADIAMYRAKKDGRGAYRLFEAAMDEQLRNRCKLELDLRRAIDAGEMELHYQPIVDCTSGVFLGFEALVRWNHPSQGRIPPGDFIPLAKECGLIVPLGLWVLETACREAASWVLPLRVAVNVSPMQFRHPALAQQVGAILAVSGLEPTRLEIEVTEGFLIDDPERALAILSDLKARGVRISLDDFGTGYSSLSYLLRFPFDKIKIDRSFVQGLGQDAQADAIVRAVIAMAGSLNLTVTAEGVETREQLSVLQAQGCDQVQGFLTGRPTPQAALSALIMLSSERLLEQASTLMAAA
jgi:diguanylate cyclase (GGDEF)-like protein/PAS domain S-box-containing protein